MWELDHNEGWAPKNWCFQIVVLEKILESPFDCKKIKLVNPKGNQPWLFIGKIDAEAETPILWHLMQTANSLEKILMLRAEKVGNRGWNHWMASQTQWAWVWANSRRQWMTGKLDVLQSMGVTKSQNMSVWTATERMK